MLLFILLSSVSSFSQNLKFEKIIEVDTNIYETTGYNILKCSDGDFLLYGSCNTGFYTGKRKMVIIKISSEGDTLWSDNIQRISGLSVFDAYEDANGYNIVSSVDKDTTGVTNHEYYLTINKYDNHGKMSDEISANNPIDGTIQIKKVNDHLVRWFRKRKLNTYYRGMEYFDLQANKLSEVRFDSIGYEKSGYTHSSKLSVFDDRTFAYSLVSHTYDDINFPIYYQFYDANGIKKNEYIVNKDSSRITNMFPKSGMIHMCNNDDFILTGITGTEYLPKKHFIRRINNEGNLLWEYYITNMDNIFTNISEDDFGNLIFSGSKFNKNIQVSFGEHGMSHDVNLFYNNLLILTENGDELFQYVWGDSTKNQRITDVFISEPGSLYLAGAINNQAYFAKMIYNPTSIEKSETSVVYSISPNPASEYIEISLSIQELQHFSNSDEIAIYDVLGEKVAHSSTSVPSGHLHQRRTLKIDISHLPKGVYFVKLGERMEKFVKL